jgi:hypothetical protein
MSLINLLGGITGDDKIGDNDLPVIDVTNRCGPDDTESRELVFQCAVTEIKETNNFGRDLIFATIVPGNFASLTDNKIAEGFYNGMNGGNYYYDGTKMVALEHMDTTDAPQTVQDALTRWTTKGDRSAVMKIKPADLNETSFYPVDFLEKARYSIVPVGDTNYMIAE